MPPQYATASVPAPAEKSPSDTNGLVPSTRSSPRDGHHSRKTGLGHRLDEDVLEAEPPAATMVTTSISSWKWSGKPHAGWMRSSLKNRRPPQRTFPGSK